MIDVKNAEKGELMSQNKNPLELYVAERFRSLYKYSRPTIASGATPVEKGDVKNPWFLIECKMRNTSGFSIKYKDWFNLKSISDGRRMDPLYIFENKKKERFAVMDFEDWFLMLEEVMEWRERYERETGNTTN